MSDSRQPKPLSEEEARQLAEHLAVLMKSGLPLSPALSAAAAEIPNRRLSLAMSTLAHELEAGKSLDQVLAANPRLLPPHMRRLIETGVRSGNLPDVLVRLVDLDRTAADLRRSIRAAMSYPILLIVLWLVLVVFLALYVMPDLGKVYHDFHTVLPLPTEWLLKLSGDWPLRVFAFLLAAVPMIIVGLRVSLRPMGWQRLLTRIPLIGRTLLWRGVANWARLLGLLLRQEILLPEAAKLAADGAYSPMMSVQGLRVARLVETGRKLSDALSTVRSLPASLVPIVRWGEDHGALAEALDTAADMFESRVQMRATVLQSILPPAVFVVIGLGALGLINVLITPMIGLIWNLSRMGWGRKRGNTFALSEEDEIHLLWVVGGILAVWLVMSLIVWLRRTALGLLLCGLSSYSDRSPSWFKTTFFGLFRGAYVLLTAAVLLLTMTIIGGPCGFLLWMATVVIALMIKVRFGDMERRSLFWSLAVAIEKGIPLPAAVRAFAAERHDKLGRQSRELARLLEVGTPLDAALAQSVSRIPSDVLLSLRAGPESRGMAARLKNSGRTAAHLDSAMHAAIARMVYLVVFLCFAAGVIGYLAMEIVPAFQKIFADFHTPLPPTTQTMIRGLYFAAHYQFVGFAILAGLLAMLLFTLARYVGLIEWDPPLLRRFSLPLEGATVLRWLADSVEGQRPLGTAVGTLARRHPKLHIRRQLHLASQRISDGGDWCDSLAAAGLVPRGEAGVLKAAQRVGNLPWAMDDMADRLARKFTSRLTGLLSIGFPLVMLVFAAVVLLVVVGLFVPLAQLVIHLS
jgi:type II secretory pathway component PulF